MVVTRKLIDALARSERLLRQIREVWSRRRYSIATLGANEGRTENTTGAAKENV
jgi:hypothetical protein